MSYWTCACRRATRLFACELGKHYRCSRGPCQRARNKKTRRNRAEQCSSEHPAATCDQARSTLLLSHLSTGSPKCVLRLLLLFVLLSGTLLLARPKKQHVAKINRSLLLVLSWSFSSAPSPLLVLSCSPANEPLIGAHYSIERAPPALRARTGGFGRPEVPVASEGIGISVTRGLRCKRRQEELGCPEVPGASEGRSI